MKIYTYPRSRSLRALWTLEEAGISYESLKVDLLSPNPAITSPHPSGKVPFLTTDDFSVSETLAICIYLCDLHPGNGLYPQNPEDKALTNSWLSFALTELEPPVWGLLKQLVLTPESQRSADIIAYFRHEANTAVARVSLKPGQVWITGDNFTLADIFMSHILMWAKSCGIGLDTEVEEYVGRAVNRPAFLKAQERNNQ